MTVPTAHRQHLQILLVVLLVVTGHVAANDHEDDREEMADNSCSNNFFTLEQSLLQSTDNRFNIMKAFFPAREAYPVVVRVSYTYKEDPGSEASDPNVWYWSESEFYLIQPLEVFQFTSLLFGNLPYRQNNLDIVLDANCSHAPFEYFQYLTTRLQLYAQSANTGPTAATQRISNSYTAVAVSLEDVSNDLVQSTFVKVWLHLMVIFIPLLSWLLLYLCDPVQLLLGDKTWTKLEDEHTHGVLAAMIQISVIITTYVFVLDIFGVYFTATSDLITHDHSAFYLSTVTGLIIDVSAFLWVIFVIVSTCHLDCRNFLRQLREKEEYSNPGRVKKLFSTIAVAPILCVANHLHYIIIAFISDPFHAGSIAIVYIISFFLFFFIFRQFYNRIVLHSNKRPKIVSRTELCPKCVAEEKTLNLLSKDISINVLSNIGDSVSTGSEEKCNCFIPGPNCHVPFNTQVVVLGLIMVGPLLIMYEVIIIALFLSLPISKSLESAPSEIYIIYQGTGLLIVGLLTYNILLNPTPFSIGKTVERLAKRLSLPENTNFWNRLSIEEKLSKVLATLLETHFQNTTNIAGLNTKSKSNNEQDKSKAKEQTITDSVKEATAVGSSTASPPLSSDIQLHISGTEVQNMAHEQRDDDHALLETEI